MAGHRPWHTLTHHWSDERKAKIASEVAELSRQIEAAKAAVRETTEDIQQIVEHLPLDDRDPPVPTDLSQLTVADLLQRASEYGYRIRVIAEPIVAEPAAIETLAAAG